jgi:ABC-2 type transport system ATP-binding protein
MNSDSIVLVQNVTRRYGARLALNDVSLEVSPGSVLGLVGANGAGKTTLIKHVLGLLRAQSGSVRVFGTDPVEAPVKVLSRMGYLSEDRDLPPWMTVGELLSYSRAFYPSWDAAYAGQLREQFCLDPAARVRNLSKGELAKAGLLVALAHRPELLVLDEPSSGLDPVVRRELLEAVVRSVASEGRTVLFSSHLLDEIARVSDRVAMLAAGQLVLHGALDEILESHRRWVVRMPEAALRLKSAPGALSITGGPEEWTVISNGAQEKLKCCLLEHRGELVEESTATFEEIFHARVGRASGVSINQS